MMWTVRGPSEPPAPQPVPDSIVKAELHALAHTVEGFLAGLESRSQLVEAHTRAVKVLSGALR